MPKIIFTKAEAILHLKKYLNFTFHCDIEIADKNHDNLYERYVDSKKYSLNKK